MQFHIRFIPHSMYKNNHAININFTQRLASQQNVLRVIRYFLMCSYNIYLNPTKLCILYGKHWHRPEAHYLLKNILPKLE